MLKDRSARLVRFVASVMLALVRCLGMGAGVISSCQHDDGQGVPQSQPYVLRRCCRLWGQWPGIRALDVI
eukprot:15473117-Alexandrium_andersonii.AAC.1